MTVNYRPSQPSALDPIEHLWEIFWTTCKTLLLAAIINGVPLFLIPGTVELHWSRSGWLLEAPRLTLHYVGFPFICFLIQMFHFVTRRQWTHRNSALILSDLRLAVVSTNHLILTLVYFFDNQTKGFCGYNSFNLVFTFYAEKTLKNYMENPDQINPKHTVTSNSEYKTELRGCPALCIVLFSCYFFQAEGKWLKGDRLLSLSQLLLPLYWFSRNVTTPPPLNWHGPNITGMNACMNVHGQYRSWPAGRVLYLLLHRFCCKGNSQNSATGNSCWQTVASCSQSSKS